MNPLATMMNDNPGEMPAVTCLCPTHGRFELLREALGCFMAQQYPTKCFLLIVNDAPKPLNADIPCVEIINMPEMFGNLGAKRQFLLEHAQTPLVAHWDDDDLYLPHHLTRSVVSALLCRDAGCVKSRGAWYMNTNKLRGIHHNTFEGSMVFWRQEALDLGGYTMKHSGQALDLMMKFRRARRLYGIPDAESPVSYVYRWGTGAGHISSFGNKPGTLMRFRRGNTDFGDGPLTPADVSGYFRRIEDHETDSDGAGIQR